MFISYIKDRFENRNGLFFLGLVIVIIYLIPLFRHPLYISIFDILDSTIPQLKILAHSGKMFADNQAIIPNMMNGLPRSVYGSEFNVLLWLNYFFTPEVAYIINQLFIHVVAYVSMYLLLSKYVIRKKDVLSKTIVLAGSLYFATLPFFSPEGLSVPLLPLVTLSLLNIKYGRYSKWDWLLLILLPLYSSFVFLYMFYIAMAGIYILLDAFINRHVNRRLLGAVFLMGAMFLLAEHRLVELIFSGHGFVSHREEFHIFFKSEALEAFRKGHVFFLNGHPQHLIDFGMPYIIPIVIIGMLLSLGTRRFSSNESMLIWLMIIVSFVSNIWTLLLTQLYTLPILTMFALIVYLLTKGTRLLPLLFLLQIFFGIFTFIAFCECAVDLQNFFPILKSLNISRLTFVQPFIWAVLLAMAIDQIRRRLVYSQGFVWLFIAAQLYIAFNSKEFSNHPLDKFATFENYYEPDILNKIREKLPGNEETRVVSYGMEPAVALYNGFYTVDGYITNYPLLYKHKFRKVIQRYLSKIKKDNVYDSWGSKVYIMSMPNQLDTYQMVKGTVVTKPSFDVEALCKLGTDYLLSSYKIESKLLKEVTMEKGRKKSRDIYLYRLVCKDRNFEKGNQ